MNLQSRERAFLDQHAKMVADIAEVESERARELKRHRTEVDEISARLDQAVRGERSASKRATEIQQQLSACESELAAVRASTKARLVQAEQVLTQLLSANDVRETELARLRAAEVLKGSRALSILFAVHAFCELLTNILFTCLPSVRIRAMVSARWRAPLLSRATLRLENANARSTN